MCFQCVAHQKISFQWSAWESIVGPGPLAERISATELRDEVSTVVPGLNNALNKAIAEIIANVVQKAEEEVH